MSREGLRGLEHPPRSEDSLVLSIYNNIIIAMRALARGIKALVRPRLALRIKIPERARAHYHGTRKQMSKIIWHKN